MPGCRDDGRSSSSAVEGGGDDSTRGSSPGRLPTLPTVDGGAAVTPPRPPRTRPGPGQSGRSGGCGRADAFGPFKRLVAASPSRASEVAAPRSTLVGGTAGRRARRTMTSSKRSIARSDGNRTGHTATTPRVSTPPRTTAGPTPSRVAATPDSNAPSSLDAPMNTFSTAATRPRMRSGVASGTIVARMNTLTASAPERTSSARKATT